MQLDDELYGIGPAIIHDLPLIRQDIERQRQAIARLAGQLVANHKPVPFNNQFGKPECD